MRLMPAWLSGIWAAARDSLASLIEGILRRPERYKAVEVQELPDRLRRGVLYVVREGSTPMHVSMACPRRRCAETLSMNLLPR